jgi:hypothetical protein
VKHTTNSDGLYALMMFWLVLLLVAVMRLVGRHTQMNHVFWGGVLVGIGVGVLLGIAIALAAWASKKSK